MSRFKKWSDLAENKDTDLVGFNDSELVFKGMNKGELTYEGEHNELKIYLTVSECCVSDYDYAPVETVVSATQGEYVYLTLDGEAILNTH